jgi:hypothetical protein
VACEITVKIKEKEKTMTLKQRFYNEVTADVCDPYVQDIVGRAEKNFGGDPMLRKVTVTIKLID